MDYSGKRISGDSTAESTKKITSDNATAEIAKNYILDVAAEKITGNQIWEDTTKESLKKMLKQCWKKQECPHKQYNHHFA